MYDFNDLGFSDFDDRERMFLPKLPQFINLKFREIAHIIRRMESMEDEGWKQETKERLKTERIEDSRYMEENKTDPILPDGEVNIQQGIIVPNIVDDRGFISIEDLDCGLKTFKFSMDNNKKKKFYICKP